MSQSDTFWSELQKLFTVVGQIDSSGRLVRASPLLAAQCRWQAQDDFYFFESFSFKRPTSFDGRYESAREAVGQLFLGFNNELGFAVRGQVVDYSGIGLDGLCFVGVPWLWWMEGNAPDQSLTMASFPVHDVQMDQLFFMSTQQSMVEDLQALNEQLKTAKQDVERSNEARQSFFHHVSHEMRTPLNGVVSSLSLMRDLGLDGKLAEYAGLASRSADRLLEVINFTLESASIESHVSDAEFTDFSLDLLIEECLAIASPLVIERGLELRRSGVQKFARPYRGPVKLLRQILGNLLSNAVKFSQSGTITLGADINEDNSDEQADIIEFSVADQGPGIPDEALPRLFTPFATGLSAETESHQGTGLGLAIVQRIVEALGGEITVQTVLGEGSIFQFAIPISHAPDDVQIEVARYPSLASADAYRGRVLLVDDHETNRLLNAKVMESTGLDVTTAGSGQEAYDALAVENNAVDLVFMDLDMPGMDGFEATRRIKALPGAETLPIIALSAHSSARDRQLAEEAGMQGFLTKPLVLEPLRAIYTRYLAHDGATPETDEGSLLAPESPVATEAHHDSSVEGALPEEDAGATMTFDRQPVDRLIHEVGVDILQTLVDKFLTESAERWELLSGSLAAADRESAVREFHTLGSACLTFGITAAGEKFRQCEAAAIEKNLPGDEVLLSIAPLLAEGISQLQLLLSEQRG